MPVDKDGEWVADQEALQILNEQSGQGPLSDADATKNLDRVLRAYTDEKELKNK